MDSRPKVKQAFDPSDGKVHVVDSRKPGTHHTRCGKTGQTTVSSAEGFWGPEGKGWDDICRECHRIEHKLKEPVA